MIATMKMSSGYVGGSGAAQSRISRPDGASVRNFSRNRYRICCTGEFERKFDVRRNRMHRIVFVGRGKLKGRWKPRWRVHCSTKRNREDLTTFALHE